jgi:PAS domain S-box-containing protein
MEKDQKHYKILFVEDNEGDFIVVEDFLLEHMEHVEFSHSKSFQDVKNIVEGLQKPENLDFDIVLLDLSLPDKSGKELIDAINEFGISAPIIVLSGYADLGFAIKSLSLGMSDYLIKENISSLGLYKSILYNIERFRFIQTLQESEKRYSELFHSSPIPMWVYDRDSVKFLDINRAAIEHYGYSFEEFLAMTIKQIRPQEDIPGMNNYESNSRNDKYFFQGVFKHEKKSGEIIHVDIRSNIIYYNGKKAEVILANDITERLNHIEAIELQNEKLREIAWKQSHVVRAPLARMLSLIHLISDKTTPNDEKNVMLDHVIQSANELDEIIRDIVSVSQQIIPKTNK